MITLLSRALLFKALVNLCLVNATTEDPKSEFIYDLKVKKGVAKSVTTKTCRWLSKQKKKELNKICDGGLEYPGGGSATNTCKVTCGTEKDENTPSSSPSTEKEEVSNKAFKTKKKLQDAVDDYCSNPEAWEPGYKKYDKYGGIQEWNSSLITDMSYLFYNQLTCNPNISLWDVSGVTTFDFMLSTAISFNQDIGDWDVSAATSFYSMFDSSFLSLGTTSSFNQDIGNWDVSASTDFSYMFNYASSFNQDIGDWDISASTSFRNMFRDASSFNQDIGDWDVSASTSFSGMFTYASSFNQTLCGWDISSSASTENFCALAITCGDCLF